VRLATAPGGLSEMKADVLLKSRDERIGNTFV
jgi:hypothetical protein